MIRAYTAVLIIFFTLTYSPVFAADEATSFPQPHNTQEVKDGFTTPAAALAAIQLPPGFRATLFAAEPNVNQPIAMATDHRGRLWIAENYTYAESTTNFDKKLRDRIVILDDTNHDGQFDRRTVFWDQASKLTSVEIGFGGVWALCPPHLLFIPDTNGDDVPDSEPQVVLDGWNDDAVRHNIANGLRWGPDGWLYGRHGILATSLVGLPGTPPELRTKINCGIWRFHPTRHVFEVVCTGTTNSWGMDWDEHGQFFFINTVIGHLWHVVPGAHFQRMYGEDFSPYYYELIPQTADHFHWDTVEVWSDIRKTGVTPTTDRAGGGHAHSGMMIYQGGAWSRRYHNTIFTVNLHGHRLNNDRLARKGAGYTATHEPDFLKTSDPWFRGTEVTASPDGDIFLADWSDIGECHENDGVHRSSGRIFKISFAGDSGAPQPGDGAAIEPDLSKSTNAYLAAALLHRNEWLVRQARRLLQERAAAGQDMSRVHEQLLKSFAEQPADTQKLRAMWGLFVTGGATQPWLLDQLRHSSEHVRAWAVQLLCDNGEPTQEARVEFRNLAKRETSGLVLLHLAASLQRTPANERVELASAIAGHADFANDPNLPLMVWYGVEPAVLENTESAVSLAMASKMPKVRRNVTRRLGTEIERRPEAVSQLVATLTGSANKADQLDILNGLADALRGWHKAPQPATWKTIASDLSKSGDSEVARLVRELSVVFGDGRAMDELRQIAGSSQADLESRRSALRSLASVKAAGLTPILQKLIDERDLQTDAIRGLAAFDDPQTPHLLVANFRRFRNNSQTEAINTLVSRPAYAQVLLEAIEKGKLAREDVTPFYVRQMQSFNDDRINQTISRLWPELKQLSAEKSRQIAKHRETLTSERLAAANIANGRSLFQRACANCHILFGQGGKVGPDLTGSQRTNLNYLLENIVDPSATVSENFRMSIVIVTDGRVINGILSEKTEKTVTVLTPTDRIVLANEDIEEVRAANLSIMPEGQLDLLTRDQVRDLFGYLMSNGGQ